MFETFSFLHCWTFVTELSMADHFMARERCTTDRHCPTKTRSARGNLESDQIHIPAIHSRFMWLVLHSDMACGCTTNRHVDFERTAVAICIIWRVFLSYKEWYNRQNLYWASELLGQWTFVQIRILDAFHLHESIRQFWATARLFPQFFADRCPGSSYHVYKRAGILIHLFVFRFSWLQNDSIFGCFPHPEQELPRTHPTVSTESYIA